MLLRNTTRASCFRLAVCDENAGTAAFGWCLEQVPALRHEVLKALACAADMELVVATQVFAEDRGFTDLELISGTSLHAIFEAKLGWGVPTVGKLERYLPRLLHSPVQTQLLVSGQRRRRAPDATRSPRGPGLAHPND